MKPRLSYDEQVDLLAQRGLLVDDGEECRDFLSKVNYYRLSGYFRYWQRDPAGGDNRFLRGSSFKVIRDLYVAEQHLKALCERVLWSVEILLRTRFAHSYAERIGAYGTFNIGKGFTRPLEEGGKRVEEYALRDLDRSKEAFVAHYRENLTAGDPYDQMPIWAAVEAFSFGTLSRLIEASGQSGVLEAMADDMKIARSALGSQVRSFVYLRNRIAHHARLWNHSVLDAPKVMPNISRRAKKAHRPFDDRSIYKILVALDGVCTNSKLRANWLEEEIEPFLSEHPLLATGVATPRKYGHMSSTDLLGNNVSL